MVKFNFYDINLLNSITDQFVREDFYLNNPSQLTNIICGFVKLNHYDHILIDKWVERATPEILASFSSQDFSSVHDIKVNISYSPSNLASAA